MVVLLVCSYRLAVPCFHLECFLLSVAFYLCAMPFALRGFGSWVVGTQEDLFTDGFQHQENSICSAGMGEHVLSAGRSQALLADRLTCCPGFSCC